MKKLLCIPGRSLYFIVTVFFISLSYSNTFASRFVTLATIGASSPSVDKSKGTQAIVDQVIEFWKRELKQVLPDRPDLILLSEVCDAPRGLNKEEMNEYYKVRKNQVQDYFASEARKNNCYIAFGTYRDSEDGSKWNSLVILNRKGEVEGIYNKNFPTIGEMEGGIKPGKETPIINCDFGRVACAICFDLNFDELRRKYEKEQPDIILFSSMYHGGPVQTNWAYTCRSFFAGAMGSTNVPSEIRNPYGAIVATTTNYFDFVVAKVNLDCELVHLDYNWDRLKKMKAKYGRDVIVDDPGKLGAVLITSEHPTITIDQMIKEFEIEKLDDYLNRARAFRNK